MNNFRKLKNYARENRKDMPSAEKLLWKCIRKDQLGVRFLRQKVVENYIVDFYCFSKKIIIELDGEYHEDIQDLDYIRDKNLNSLGFKVLRFWNYEVENDIESVLEVIRLAINNPS